jgi:AcrR family transcriptional regulator
MDDNLLLPDDSRPARSDAVKNHALLLETAQRLIDEQGLENVSMSDIAEAAGVGKGTLYRNFRNKSDLAHALLDQEQRDLQTRALRRFQNNGDALEDLRWFLEQLITFVDHNSPILCVAAQEGVTAVLDAPPHRWWRQSIRGLLMRVQPHPSVDIDYLADMLYVMCEVHTIYFQKQTLGYDTNRILQNLNNLLSTIYP